MRGYGKGGEILRDFLWKVLYKQFVFGSEPVLRWPEATCSYYYYSRSKPRTTTRFPLFFSSFFPSLFSSSSTAAAAVVDCIHFPSLQLPLWLPHHGQCPRFLDVRPTSGSSTQPLSFFPTPNQKGRKDTGLITIRSGFPPKDTEKNSARLANIGQSPSHNLYRAQLIPYHFLTSTKLYVSLPTLHTYITIS